MSLRGFEPLGYPYPSLPCLEPFSKNSGGNLSPCGEALQPLERGQSRGRNSVARNTANMPAPLASVKSRNRDHLHDFVITPFFRDFAPNALGSILSLAHAFCIVRATPMKANRPKRASGPYFGAQTLSARDRHAPNRRGQKSSKPIIRQGDRLTVITLPRLV